MTLHSLLSCEVKNVDGIVSGIYGNNNVRGDKGREGI